MTCQSVIRSHPAAGQGLRTVLTDFAEQGFNSGTEVHRGRCRVGMKGLADRGVGCSPILNPPGPACHETRRGAPIREHSIWRRHPAKRRTAAGSTSASCFLAGQASVALKMTGMSGTCGQDLPTPRQIFRAEERRSNRDDPAGFRGCGTARVPIPAPFPARMPRSGCLTAFRRVPAALASQSRVPAAMAALRSSCSRRRVSVRLSASRQLAKIAASAKLSGDPEPERDISDCLRIRRSGLRAPGRRPCLHGRCLRTRL